MGLFGSKLARFTRWSNAVYVLCLALLSICLIIGGFHMLANGLSSSVLCLPHPSETDKSVITSNFTTTLPTNKLLTEYDKQIVAVCIKKIHWYVSYWPLILLAQLLPLFIGYMSRYVVSKAWSIRMKWEKSSQLHIYYRIKFCLHVICIISFLCMNVVYIGKTKFQPEFECKILQSDQSNNFESLVANFGDKFTCTNESANLWFGMAIAFNVFLCLYIVPIIDDIVWYLKHGKKQKKIDKFTKEGEQPHKAEETNEVEGDRNQTSAKWIVRHNEDQENDGSTAQETNEVEGDRNQTSAKQIGGTNKDQENDASKAQESIEMEVLGDRDQTTNMLIVEADVSTENNENGDSMSQEPDDRMSLLLDSLEEGQFGSLRYQKHDDVKINMPLDQADEPNESDVPQDQADSPNENDVHQNQADKEDIVLRDMVCLLNLRLENDSVITRCIAWTMSEEFRNIVLKVVYPVRKSSVEVVDDTPYSIHLKWKGPINDSLYHCFDLETKRDLREVIRIPKKKNEGEHQLLGLTPGVMFEVSLFTVREIEEGSRRKRSKPVKFTVQTPPIPPNAFFQEPDMTDKDISNTLGVSWIKPEETNQHRYRRKLANEKNEQIGEWKKIQNHERTHYIEDLRPATKYRIVIGAFCETQENDRPINVSGYQHCSKEELELILYTGTKPEKSKRKENGAKFEISEQYICLKQNKKLTDISLKIQDLNFLS